MARAHWFAPSAPQITSSHVCMRGEPETKVGDYIMALLLTLLPMPLTEPLLPPLLLAAALATAPLLLLPPQ